MTETDPFTTSTTTLEVLTTTAIWTITSTIPITVTVSSTVYTTNAPTNTVVKVYTVTSYAIATSLTTVTSTLTSTTTTTVVIASATCAPGRVFDSATGQCFKVATKQTFTDLGSCGQGGSGYTVSILNYNNAVTNALSAYELTVRISASSLFEDSKGTGKNSYILQHTSPSSFGTFLFC
jgi:hypothetical protein